MNPDIRDYKGIIPSVVLPLFPGRYEAFAKADVTAFGVVFKNIPLRPKRKITRRKDGIHLTIDKCGLINWFNETTLTLADPSVLNEPLI